MSFDFYQFVSLDLPPLLTALFASITCALVGNFLVLRRISLMGDAISHAVLPGIVAGFLISGSRASLPVLIGAAAAGMATTVLVEIVRKLGRVEEGTAMGVVFSILFALGVLLMEQAAARNIDLDADCILHGQLETVFWHPPQEVGQFLSWNTLSLVPTETLTSFIVFLVSALFISLLYKELKLVSFDPALASAIGFNSNVLHYLLMIIVALAVVASFQAVGSILVIAMIICPAATARLLTDRLNNQIALSIVFGATATVLGYLLGAFGPLWLGYANSLNVAGTMTVVSGLLLSMSILFAPRYGVLGREYRRLRFAGQVAKEDLLGFLFRFEELRAKGSERLVSLTDIKNALGASSLTARALRTLRRQKLISIDGTCAALTDQGRLTARSVVRTHRLWESYLVKQLGLRADHVHETATKLEHVTSPMMVQEIAEQEKHPLQDPHGKDIP